MPDEEKTSEFTRIEDESTVARYLQYMIDLAVPVQCALRGTDFRFETKARQVLNKNTIHLEMINAIMSADALKERVNTSKSGMIDLTYRAQDVLIFADTRMRSADKDGIALEVEPPLFKLQRRSNLRVKPESNITCYVRLRSPADNDEFIELNPYDISCTGFSLLLSQEEGQLYKKGDHFEAEFHFQGNEAPVKATVASRFEIRGAGKSKIKLGFSMSPLPASLEQEVSKYAYSVTQKILSRRI